MKHEQAALVATAWVIGFTTAFIAFAIQPDLVRTEINFDIEQPTVINANPASVVSAFTTAEGLFAHLGTEDRILSAKTESVSDGLAGTHAAVHGVTVSPDGRFIHFCEQESSEETVCTCYVYRVGSDSVTPVKSGGKNLVAEIATLTVTWGADGTLYVNDLHSVSADEPWLVL